MKTTINTKLVLIASLLMSSGLVACLNGANESTHEDTEVIVINDSPDEPNDDTVVDDVPSEFVTLQRGNPLSLSDGTIVVHGEFATHLDGNHEVVWQTEIEGQLEEMVWTDGESLWVVSKATGADRALELDVATGEVVQALERDTIFELQVSQSQLAMMSRHDGSVALERFEVGSMTAVDRFENPDSFVLTKDGGVLVSMGGGDGYAVMAFDSEGVLVGQSVDFVDPPFVYESGHSFAILGQTERVSSANPYDLFGYTSELQALWSRSDVFNADVDPESGLLLISDANDDRTAFVLAELEAETGVATTVVEQADWGFYQPAVMGDAHYYVPYGPAEVPTFINASAGLAEVQLPGLVWPELAVAEGLGLLVRPTSGVRDFDSDLMLLSPTGETVFNTQIDVRSDRPIVVEEGQLRIVEANELVVLDMSGSEVARVPLTD